MTLKRKIGSVAAAAAMLGITATTAITTAGPAAADPPQYNGYVGVGSDTTQDVMNALSGFNQNSVYTPIFSDSGNPRSTIVSFDAVPPAGVSDGCITTRVKSPTFARPQGSGSGQRALSRSLDNTTWGPNPTATPALQCAEPGKLISGLVDFARSSSGPSGGAGTVLTFIPFATDALTYAYSRPTGGAAVTDLTTAELNSIYRNNDPANNPTIITRNGVGVPVIACGIQTGAGTYGSWNGFLGLTSATPDPTEDVATSACRALSTPTSDAITGRFEENQGNAITDKAAALPTTGPLAGAQVIAGFSVSNFISQSNGNVTSQLGTVALGSINGQAPYDTVIATGKLAANTSFYTGAYSREVFNVVSQQRMIQPGSLGLKELFISNPTGSALGTGQVGRGLPASYTAVICRPAAQAIVNSFGFLTPADCGSTTRTAGTRTGTF